MTNIKYILTALLVCNLSFAESKKVNKKVKYRKTQEVNFDAQGIDGLARTPTGSYLVQKRGVDFVPLYKVKEKLDESIEESIEYLRYDKLLVKPLLIQHLQNGNVIRSKMLRQSRRTDHKRSSRLP